MAIILIPPPATSPTIGINDINAPIVPTTSNLKNAYIIAIISIMIPNPATNCNPGIDDAIIKATSIISNIDHKIVCTVSGNLGNKYVSIAHISTPPF